MEKAKELLPYEAKPWLQTDVRPLVQLRNVSKRFGGFTAVSNISLDIYKGELFCLLGGSGCGKTTLLRQLAGFEDLSDGSIEIDGQQMADVPPHLRPVNMMFQSYALFPHMNVERNVAYGLRREGLAASEIASRVEYMLDLVKLAGYEKRSPNELSGGQCQRVALARALVKRPKLLLLDEPLAALDKKLRVETQLELVKIQETLGTTFIVVTHDQEEAMTIATRIGVMDAGEIVQVGEPQEMYEYPRNRFVASFIGSVNIFEGTVVASEADHLRIRSEEASCSIYVPHGLGCTVGQRLWYAVRPDKLTASSTQPEQDSNWLAGKIDDIAYLGDVTSYRIILPSGKIVHVSRMNESRSMRAPLTWDDSAYISWEANSGVVLLS